MKIPAFSRDSRQQDRAARGASSAVSLALCCCLVLSGCAGKEPEKDKFYEHWQNVADKSQGNSPSPAPRKADTATPIDTGKDKTKVTEPELSSKRVIYEEKPAQKLPVQRVSLKMYNVDVVTVLRALARIASQNIVVSAAVEAQSGKSADAPRPGGQGAGAALQKIPNMPGLAGGDSPLKPVSINIENSPWDEAFLSILHSSGLTYTWEGSIIRVVTLGDLENDQKMKEVQEKIIVQKEKLKMSDPMLTTVVKVNYANLDEIYDTVKKYLDPSSAMKKRLTLEAQAQSLVSESGSSSGSGGGGGAGGAQIPGGGAGGGGDGKGEDLGLAGGKSFFLPGKTRAFVNPDFHTNSLIIQASKENTDKIVQLIDQLDQARPQVLLKAYIVETRRSTLQELGVQWGGLLKSTTAGGNTFMMSPASTGTGSYTQIETPAAFSNVGETAVVNPYTGQTLVWPGAWPGNPGSPIYQLDPYNGNNTPIYSGGTSGQGFGLNFPSASFAESAISGLGGSGAGVNFFLGKIGETVLEAQLSALAEAGKVNILSNPSIATLENRLAVTTHGKEVPYVSTSQLSGTNVQFKKAELFLGMVPHIIDNKNLRMEILVKDDQVDPDKNNWVQGNPPLFTKRTVTELVVEDGDTIVISGLTKDNLADGTSGVPFLKDIPALGWAFKSKSNSIEKNDVLIFITPVVLREKPYEMAPKKTETASYRDGKVVSASNPEDAARLREAGFTVN